MEENRLLLRKKWKEIMKDVEPKDICDSLYQEKVLDEEDMETIHKEGLTRKRRCQHILFKIYMKNDAQCIPNFFKSLEESYDHLCCGVHEYETEISQSHDTVSERDMALLSRSISDVWKEIGVVAGGLTFRDIKEIEEICSINRPMRMLQKWRFNAGNKELNVRPLTKQEILMVIKDLDLSIGIEIREIFKKNSEI